MRAMRAVRAMRAMRAVRAMRAMRAMRAARAAGSEAGAMGREDGVRLQQNGKASCPVAAHAPEVGGSMEDGVTARWLRPGGLANPGAG